MFNKYKISFFKDKKDIELIFTDDDIINITGVMGSGKTTLAKTIANKSKRELIVFDWMFCRSLGNRPVKIEKLLKKFEKQYPETVDQQIFKSNNSRDNAIEIQKYAGIIYEFVIKNIELPMVIEGQHLYKWMDYNKLRGKIIIKRTSFFNSYIRAFKRDVSRLYKQYKRKEATKRELINKVFERVKIPIKDYYKINKFILTMVEVKNERY